MFQWIKWRHTYNIEYVWSMGRAGVKGSRPRGGARGFWSRMPVLRETPSDPVCQYLCIVLCIRACSAVVCQPSCREKPQLCSLKVLTSCISLPKCLHPASIADFAKAVEPCCSKEKGAFHKFGAKNWPRDTQAPTVGFYPTGALKPEREGPI